ncbi:MAG: RDD family protein [Chitinophagales bacterium]|nr:RDD family protein [Chitinophagales bacterium]
MKDVDNQLLKIYYKASFQKRMANYFIDGLVVLPIIWIIIPSKMIPSFEFLPFVNVFIPPFLLLKAIYYLIFEMNGFTLGKLITKTKVVKENNLPTKPVDIIARTLVRLLPFNAVSFLWGENNGRNSYATGWHDQWTKTKVVDLTKEKVIPIEQP